MIVLIATGWNSGGGGISAFNIALAMALAHRAPGAIACAVVSRGAGDLPRQEGGVLLLPVPAGKDPDRPAEDCGDAIIGMLRSRNLPAVSHWLGHDLITGQAAVNAARRHGGTAAVVHHMDYLAYQNLGGGRGDQTAENHARQIALFGAADVAFGVGTRLALSARALGAGTVHTIVPGFPAITPPSHRRTDSLRAITAGRFDEKSEPVKQTALLARAFGRAVRKGGTLRSPSLTLLGVAAGRASTLEGIAATKAGRAVNVVPARFHPDRDLFATFSSRANLAILPSRHEGFGLVGWEAIGTGTPLILGDDTGLAEQLRETLPTTCESLATIVAMDCDDDEIEARLAEAILSVAGNIPLALRKARDLRAALVNELGCSWDEAARCVLEALDFPTEPFSPSAARRPAPSKVFFASRSDNHFQDCVELSLGVGQGATSRSIELIAELRFGKTELDLGDFAAEIAMRAARLRVITENGRLEGMRLGDPERPVPGVEARAGGIWALAAEKGEILPNKVLGNDALCRIEAPLGKTVRAAVEVTAAQRDLVCRIHRPGKPPRSATARVMEIFLKNAIFKEDSGHILFSTAHIEESGDADE